MTQISIITKEIAPLVKSAEKLIISNEKELTYSAELSAQLKAKAKAIKEDREKITAPMVEALEAVREKYRPTENEVKQAIEMVTKAQSTYQTEQIRIRKAEEQKIADRVKSGKGNLSIESGLKKLEAIDKPVAVVATSIGQLKFRTDRILKVWDHTLIPLEYYDLNESKLLKDLKAGKQVSGAGLEEVQTPVNR